MIPPTGTKVTRDESKDTVAKAEKCNVVGSWNLAEKKILSRMQTISVISAT